VVVPGEPGGGALVLPPPPEHAAASTPTTVAATTLRATPARIGFAIPVDTVARVVGDLIEFGYVRRPWVGIGTLFPMEGYPVSLARRSGITTNEGFMVENIRRGSPAAVAGIRSATGQAGNGFRVYPVGGDILVAFEGEPITSIPELAAQIDHFKAGDKVTFTVIRGTQKIDIPVVLQETPPEAR
jgi:S1-C subfamily serine protease